MLVAPHKFRNLDEAFYWVNRQFLVSPHKIIQFIRGAQGFAEDILLTVREPISELNLNEFAFNPTSKWNHLIRSYVDPDDYWTFWENLKTVTGTSYQFRFKNKKTGNGPCLIAVVLTRDHTGSPFTRAKVIWRTAELQRKFAADIVLIHNFFREIPEEVHDKIRLEEVSLYLAQAFQSWRLVGPLVDHFCEWEEVDTSHEYGQRVVTNFEKVYKEPQPELKYAPVIRMQNFYLKRLAGEIEYTHPNELSLASEVKKIKGDQ